MIVSSPFTTNQVSQTNAYMELWVDDAEVYQTTNKNVAGVTIDNYKTSGFLEGETNIVFTAGEHWLDIRVDSGGTNGILFTSIPTLTVGVKQ